MKNFKEIQLSNSEPTLVSDADYELLIKWKWHINKNGYVVRNSTSKQICMHQAIMGNKNGYCIDHIDRNKLNNTRENLRFVTKSQNNLNRGVDPRSKTGYNGISICKTGSYRARLSEKELGRFKTLEDAIKAREKSFNEAFQSTETNQ